MYEYAQFFENCLLSFGLCRLIEPSTNELKKAWILKEKDLQSRSTSANAKQKVSRSTTSLSFADAMMILKQEL